MPDLDRLKSALDHLDRAPEVLACRRLTRQWPLLTAAYLGAKDLSYPFLIRLKDGRQLQLHGPGDLATAWAIFFREEYRVDPSCRTIVDGGASLGAFTLQALSCAPKARVWALEPFPETFHQLELTIARNNQITRVSTHQLALAPEVGAGDAKGGGLPSPERVLVEDASSKDVSAEALPLGEFLGREGLETLDLLRLDMGGEEHPLLQGTPDAVLKRVRALVMEYQPRAPKEPLFGRLIASGFRLEHDREINAARGIAHFRR